MRSFSSLNLNLTRSFNRSKSSGSASSTSPLPSPTLPGLLPSLPISEESTPEEIYTPRLEDLPEDVEYTPSPREPPRIDLQLDNSNFNPFSRFSIFRNHDNDEVDIDDVDIDVDVDVDDELSFLDHEDEQGPADTAVNPLDRQVEIVSGSLVTPQFLSPRVLSPRDKELPHLPDPLSSEEEREQEQQSETERPDLPIRLSEDAIRPTLHATLGTQASTSTFSEAASELPPLTPTAARGDAASDSSTSTSTVQPPTVSRSTLSPGSVNSPPSKSHRRRPSTAPAISTPPSTSGPSRPTQPLQHTLSTSGPPPDYSAIPQPPNTTQSDSFEHRPREPPSPRSIANRNDEKQALRDLWAEQDAVKQAASERQQRNFAAAAAYTSGQSNTFERNSGSDGSGGQRWLAGSDRNREAKRIYTALVGQGILPAGMDIREALAKCEDPSVGWSMQFWVTIADPQTQNVFFACPASGECSWDPPVGAMIVPRMPEGEWWELADVTRGNRCYYYNTMSGKTQWSRPQEGAFVIPLGLIQRNALPTRTEGGNGRISKPAYSNYFPPDRQPRPPVTPTKRSSTSQPRSSNGTPGSQTSPRKSRSGSSSPTKHSLTSTSPIKTSEGSERGFPSEPSGSTVVSNGVLRTPLSVVDEAETNDGEMSDQSIAAGWWDKPRGSPLAFQGMKKISKPGSASKVSRPGNGLISDVTNGTVLPKEEIVDPIFVDSIRTKRMSTGLHPLLPTSISTEIKNFQAEDFASRYFATKRTGVLRQRVPFEEIMQWQKQPITAPLLVISKTLTKDALTTFRVIQHVMGERDRPVEHARPTHSAANAINAAGREKGGPYQLKRTNASSAKVNGSKVNVGQDGTKGENSPTLTRTTKSGGEDEKYVVLEEIRWMIQLAVSEGEMRDEVYSQLIKQLTRNPSPDKIIMGFQLFCVLVNSFGPSKKFEGFVKHFLSTNGRGTDGLARMAQYCSSRLEILAKRGGRGKSLTIGEIEHAADAAFYPSVYGEPLDQIMSLQVSSYPDLKVPVILPFLADGILALGGLQAEGIFRVPGDADSVSELKSRMDRGHYVLTGIEDPHVGASLFKLWLRDLEHPVIPEEMYNDALVAAKSTEETLEFIDRLPVVNRRVLLFVISFLQLFLRPEVVEVTKMTVNNLALVLAPNILRTTSNHLVTVFTNSSFESKFAWQLLENLDPQTADPDYQPVHDQRS